MVVRHRVGNCDGHCGAMGITGAASMCKHGIIGPQVSFVAWRMLGKEEVLLDESKVISTKREYEQSGSV